MSAIAAAAQNLTFLSLILNFCLTKSSQTCVSLDLCSVLDDIVVRPASVSSFFFMTSTASVEIRGELDQSGPRLICFFK